ncbi:MAG: hypothetical protein ABEJ36_01185 [Candidatus Nanosalina sp.]
MRTMSDYGLMSFRASAIYFMIIQGFGFLLAMEYSAFQLFGISTVGVILFNIWALIDSHYDLPRRFSGCGAHGFMDEREMKVATTAAAYGFMASILAASINQGGIYALTQDQIAQIGFAVFLGLFITKTAYQRFGGR